MERLGAHCPPGRSARRIGGDGTDDRLPVPLVRPIPVRPRGTGALARRPPAREPGPQKVTTAVIKNIVSFNKQGKLLLQEKYINFGIQHKTIGIHIRIDSSSFLFIPVLVNTVDTK